MILPTSILHAFIAMHVSGKRTKHRLKSSDRVINGSGLRCTERVLENY